MDTKIKIIKDKFNDLIGILIVSKEVKELVQFKLFYKITERESEVIQHIIEGEINKDIAKKLNIAERTIKTHISNIYNKLGINNKMQLMNLLKDFNILPEKSAEKKFLILKK